MVKYVMRSTKKATAAAEAKAVEYGIKIVEKAPREVTAMEAAFMAAISKQNAVRPQDLIILGPIEYFTRIAHSVR